MDRGAGPPAAARAGTAPSLGVGEGVGGGRPGAARRPPGGGRGAAAVRGRAGVAAPRWGSQG